MAFEGFLKIDGADGESTDDKHKSWMEILSFSLGADQPLSSTVSSSGGASAGRVDLKRFTITKLLDKGSPKLFEKCCTGEHVKEVKVELCRAGGDKMTYMKYTMNDVMIASYSPSGKAFEEALPTEEISFDYAKIQLEYTVQGRDGKPAGNTSAGWDAKA